MEPAISVVIPARNAGATIEEALRSTTTQTRAPAEVIVVDDGSTDDTAHRARSFGARVIAGTGEGASAARDIGWRASGSPYIAMLDADDHWLPSHTALVAGLLDRFPRAGLAYGLCELFGTMSHIWDRRLPDEVPTWAFWDSVRSTIAPHNALIMRRSLLEAADGYDRTVRYATDFDFLIRASRLAPFVCTHTVTARYRKHDRGLSAHRMACHRSEMASRAAALRRLEEEGASEAEVARFRRIWGEVIDGYLSRAWDARDIDYLRGMLELAESLPIDGVIVQRWQRRLLVFPVARIVDRVRR